MRRYVVSGLVLETSLPIPEVPEAPDERRPQCRFDLRPPHSQDDGDLPGIPIGRDQADEDPWITVARTPAGFRLRFRGLADFLVDEAGSSITAIPVPGSPEVTIRHLLLDQVVPRVLSLHGAWVVHASAVALPAGAVLFLGDTGRGKSTLALAFHEAGAPLLADDAVALAEQDRGLTAWPSYPGVRLWPEDVAASTPTEEVAHYTTKVRLDPGRRVAMDEPRPVARLYLLDEGSRDDLEILPVRTRDALMTLVEGTFRVDVTGKDRTRREFERLSDSPALALVRRLVYPRRREALAGVRDAVLADVGAPR